MNFRAYQPNFSRGELAPQLYARFDADVYSAAAKRVRNMFILKYGGLRKRPGTRLVAEVLDDSEENRLIPFEFSYTQTYALEMGQGYMAPCSAGGRVLEAELAITAITNAANAQITAVYHGYSVGNAVWLTGIAGDLGKFLNGRRWIVQSVVDADNFTIDADTSSEAAFTTATGGETRTGAPPADPTPPTVNAPVEEESPPVVGGGGGGGGGFASDSALEEY